MFCQGAGRLYQSLLGYFTFRFVRYGQFPSGSLVKLHYCRLGQVGFVWITLVLFGCISLNYVMLVCEREILTIHSFVMICVGFPASVDFSIKFGI